MEDHVPTLGRAIAPAICRYCGDKITFEITHRGNPRPLNASDGEIHFATCERRRATAASANGASAKSKPALRDDCACNCPGHDCWYCKRGEHIREPLPAATEEDLGLDDA